MEEVNHHAPGVQQQPAPGVQEQPGNRNLTKQGHNMTKVAVQTAVLELEVQAAFQAGLKAALAGQQNQNP